jgi:hypothetical protein
MKKFFTIFLLLPFFLLNCKSKADSKTEKPWEKDAMKKKPSLMGAWKIAVNPLLNGTTSDDAYFENDEQMEPVKAKTDLWAFYPDGNYTSIDDKFNYLHGTWKFVNNKKSIEINTGADVATYNLKVIVGGYKLKLELTDEINNIVKKFERHSDIPVDFKLDPFYASNNEWREKPASAENEAQIKNRLSNYIKHVSFILKTALENDQLSASFEFSEGIIKIYDGGIGVTEDKTIPSYWKAAFNNTDDAKKGLELFKKQLQNAAKKITGTGNWYIDDYNILANVYKKMNSDTLPALKWESKDEDVE